MLNRLALSQFQASNVFKTLLYQSKNAFGSQLLEAIGKFPPVEFKKPVGR